MLEKMQKGIEWREMRLATARLHIGVSLMKDSNNMTLKIVGIEIFAVQKARSWSKVLF